MNLNRTAKFASILIEFTSNIFALFVQCMGNAIHEKNRIKCYAFYYFQFLFAEKSITSDNRIGKKLNKLEYNSCKMQLFVQYTEKKSNLMCIEF